MSGAVRTWAFRRRGELIYFLQPGEARIEHTNGEWIEVEIRPVQAEKEREVGETVRGWAWRRCGRIEPTPTIYQSKLPPPWTIPDGGRWVRVEVRELEEEEPEPVKCACGADGRAMDSAAGAWHVECATSMSGEGCWSGPFKPTRREAVLAWNALMERAK